MKLNLALESFKNEIFQEQEQRMREIANQSCEEFTSDSGSSDEEDWNKTNLGYSIKIYNLYIYVHIYLNNAMYITIYYLIFVGKCYVVIKTSLWIKRKYILVN